MKKQILILFISLCLGLTANSQPKPKTVMLLLGSDHPEILANRVKVALKLYHTSPIDKIIVSGGCAAHASSICEASEMKSLLVNGGVPANIVYKEENSKTTTQNYIFSRVLTDENGDRIISKNDSLYVVSDHWHAIAVAARFKKYDGVNARFFIEGDIEPKATDALDYVGLFNKITDNNDFILKNTWPTPDAVFNNKGLKHYLFLDRIYTIDKLNKPAVQKLNEFWPALPQQWNEQLDAVTPDTKNQQLLLFKGLQCQVNYLKARKAPLTIPVSQLVAQLPADVKYIDAACMVNNQLYLFVKDKLVTAARKGKFFSVIKTEPLKTRFQHWPYAWGSGDLTAADYDEETQTLYLYKNRQYIKVPASTNVLPDPEKLTLKWVGN